MKHIKYMITHNINLKNVVICSRRKHKFLGGGWDREEKEIEIRFMTNFKI